MILGGVVALVFGFDAERKSLEDIADPLSRVPSEDVRAAQPPVTDSL
jgi:hypothetical protein